MVVWSKTAEARHQPCTVDDFTATIPSPAKPYPLSAMKQFHARSEWSRQLEVGAATVSEPSGPRACTENDQPKTWRRKCS
uniref:Uncharacterized protein n=1 Tax=Escherichia coli TaxID=562 RepID=A0A8F1IET8_ECOLX|nr:hypothetical protein IHCLGBEB_00035 [Escherichia coli]